MRPKIITGIDMPTEMPTTFSFTEELGSDVLVLVTNGLFVQLHGAGVGVGGGGGGIRDMISRSPQRSLNSAWRYELKLFVF